MTVFMKSTKRQQNPKLRPQIKNITALERVKEKVIVMGELCHDLFYHPQANL